MLVVVDGVDRHCCIMPSTHEMPTCWRSLIIYYSCHRGDAVYSYSTTKAESITFYIISLYMYVTISCILILTSVREICYRSDVRIANHTQSHLMFFGALFTYFRKNICDFPLSQYFLWCSSCNFFLSTGPL